MSGKGYRKKVSHPCPCGHHGDVSHPCVCAAAEVARYRGRLSGPLADRIDLHVHVPPVALSRLATRDASADSAAVRALVERARGRQRARFARDDACNARAPGRWLETHGGLEAAGRMLLTSAGERLHLSARAFHRVLRVARTIADLDGSRLVCEPHVAEALGYRPRDVATGPLLARPPA